LRNSSYSNRYLVAELTGGLGNQLFGLAACLGLSERLGLDPAYTLVNYKENNPRKFELEKIVNSFDLKLVDDYEFVFKESKFYEFDEGSLGISPGTAMRGYFQNHRYFSNIDKLLRPAILNAAEDKVAPGSVERIAIHQRRGDYLLPIYADFHGVASNQYFVSAVRTLRNIWGPLPVEIFSDSPDEGARLASQISGAIYRDDTGMNPLEVLFELSKYRYLVGSNSSFSWWAAYLSEHQYGNVIFPKPWITGNNAEDLLLDGWISLPISGIA
jgi:hypothetical protein